MSGTLKLTHKTIGVEVRRGTYDAVVDGKHAGTLELKRPSTYRSNLDGTLYKSATAETPAEPRPSTSPRAKSPASDAAERASCRSFFCPMSFLAWHSRSRASRRNSPNSA